MRGSVIGLAMLAWVGCGDEGTPEAMDPIPVLDPYGLTPVSADRDPFVDHRPLFFNCPTATWGPEGGGFEIQTGACDYAAFDQAVPMALEAGDTLAISVWHDLLDSPEPATGHVAVWVGSSVVWETEVAIPTASAVLEAEVTLKTTPPPDARLGLHLHNHGFNSWRFVEVTVVPR